MKTIKFTGTLPGPLLRTPLLEKCYDFSEGICEMEDSDASLLLLRCPAGYTDITGQALPKDTVVVKGTEHPSAEEVATAEAELEAARAKQQAAHEAEATAEAERLAKEAEANLRKMQQNKTNDK